MLEAGSQARVQRYGDIDQADDYGSRLINATYTRHRGRLLKNNAAADADVRLVLSSGGVRLVSSLGLLVQPKFSGDSVVWRWRSREFIFSHHHFRSATAGVASSWAGLLLYLM